MEYPGIHGATINSSKQRSAAKTALGFKREVTETDMDSSPNSFRMTHKKSYAEEVVNKKTPSDSMRQIFPRDAQSVI